ncbi:hypothetical protein KY330_05990 [Candidatus Woesearchaeota archaeon]|nr:hypothetical protein [Candidatus Woesearchaeota archaeon]
MRIRTGHLDEEDEELEEGYSEDFRNYREEYPDEKIKRKYNRLLGEHF